MLTKEALDVLALRPGATPTEIKEAYRDLVKVWHPDRFGSDPRLRQKADDKLKQLNDAYRVLQSGPVMGDRDGTEAETAASGSWSDTSSRYSSSTTMPRHGGLGRNIVSAGWIYGFLGISLGCLAGYLMLDRGWVRAAKSLPVPIQQTADTNEPKTQAISNAGTPGEVLGKPDVRAAEQANGNVGRDNTGGLNRAGPAQYRVFSLSDAQTSQLESACSSQKELHGEAAYQACVKVQLDLITNASSPPDLSSLSTAERESIESACSEAKRRHGLDTYNRCRNAQMASLAAEPSRPDLSTLSEADRNSIESACRNTKYREGPAAYDRCLMRFIKLLAESK